MDTPNTFSVARNIVKAKKKTTMVDAKGSVYTLISDEFPYDLAGCEVWITDSIKISSPQYRFIDGHFVIFSRPGMKHIDAQVMYRSMHNENAIN